MASALAVHSLLGLNTACLKHSAPTLQVPIRGLEAALVLVNLPLCELLQKAAGTMDLFILVQLKP